MRLSQAPNGYTRPAHLPVLTVERARALLPRLRCGACRGRLLAELPSTEPGTIACPACGREYAEIVERVPVRLTAAQWHALPDGAKRHREFCGCSVCRARRRSGVTP